MKRDEIIKRISKAAKRKGLKFEMVRSGAEHDIWRCGATSTSIPRHREIGPKMEFEIYKDLEPVLGPRWWR